MLHQGTYDQQQHKATTQGYNKAPRAKDRPPVETNVTSPQIYDIVYMWYDVYICIIYLGTKSNYQGSVQQNAWKEFELWQQMQNENEMMKWNEMKTKIEKQNKLREKQTIKGKVAVEDSASSLWRLPRAPREPRALFQKTSRTACATRSSLWRVFTSKVFTLHRKVFTKALHTSH